MEPKQASPPATSMKLPTLVFGVVEVRRLLREIESLDEFMQQANIRQEHGVQAPQLPRVSRMLDALASENHCNLLKKPERDRLSQFLQSVASSAPSIHMSFATDPSAAFTAKIVSWLRTYIHPLVLLQIGLQPTIAAGCIVRTNNRVFDMSLRHRFEEQQAILIKSLQGGQAS